MATCLGENTTQDSAQSDDSSDGIDNVQVKAVIQCLGDEADFNFDLCEKRVSNILNHCRGRARAVADFCYNKAKTEAAAEQCKTEYGESKASCRETATQNLVPCTENYYLRDAIACVEKHSTDSATTVTQD